MSPKKCRTEFFSSLATLLLVVGYLVSVSGINVHYDVEHERTYVVSGFFASDCESIHPHSACSDSEEACLQDEECCTDELRTVFSHCDGSDCQPDAPVPVFRCLPVFRPVAAPAISGTERVVRFQRPPPDPVGACSRFCVLRV